MSDQNAVDDEWAAALAEQRASEAGLDAPAAPAAAPAQMESFAPTSNTGTTRENGIFF